MSIEVENISKKFGDFVALEDVSVTIPTGQLTALLGPSGGGKSTLLRIIAGLESTDSGTVTIEGKEATHLPPQKRNVGFVFQHYAAFKHMTVAKNIAFGLEIRTHGGLRPPWTPRRQGDAPGGLRPPWAPQRRADRERIQKRVAELLELVHLSQFGHRLPSQLSGGQRQRMALARALAVEPNVLLLDEPFGALDAKVRKELRDWLRRLHDEMHVTTVFVTHDQEEALEVADEIVIINDGRIEQVGGPDDLYDIPANDFVMSFLGPVTTLDGSLVRPHDVDVRPATGEGATGAVAGTVERITRIGFEVRIDVRPEAEGPSVQATMTRMQSSALGLEEGQRVWLLARDGHRPTNGESLVGVGQPG